MLEEFTLVTEDSANGAIYPLCQYVIIFQFKTDKLFGIKS